MRHRSAASSLSCRRAVRRPGVFQDPRACTVGDPRFAPSPTRSERRWSILCERGWRHPACMRLTRIPPSLRELLPDSENHRRPDRGIPIYQTAGVNTRNSIDFSSKHTALAHRYGWVSIRHGTGGYTTALGRLSYSASDLAWAASRVLARLGWDYAASGHRRQ